MKTLLAAVYPLDWALIFLVGLAGAWRIVRGPTVLDRLLGFDALTVAVCALIAVHSIRTRTADYMELIIVVTGLGFFTTVAFFYYLIQTTPNSRSSSLDEPDRPAPGARKGDGA
ncbi:MAG: hypothetical protein RLZZ50_129 [Verrucomicrobiota bacterium]